MRINTKTIVSMTEANQNFSKVAKLVDDMGTAIIMKNNTPRYVILDFDKVDAVASDEDVLSASMKLIQKNHEAYEVLAK